MLLQRQGHVGGKIAARLAKGSSQICHVCGKSGHISGFIGARYVDCINKPCYICGEKTHSTQTCPHRLAPQLSCLPADEAKVSNGGIIKSLMDRERGLKKMHQSPAPSPGAWEIDAAVIKLHARRTTCLEFHPTRSNVVISGDKHGQVAVWDIDKVFERTVYTQINKWLTNSIKCLKYGSDDHFATSSYDGTVKIFDVDIGLPIRTLVDANPEGWEHVEEADKAGRWVTFIGLDTVANGLVVSGASNGKLYFLDTRSPSPASVMQSHKPKTKIQSVNANPVNKNLILTAGNDYFARIHDLRRLGHTDDVALPKSILTSAEVTNFEHPRVINAAQFSPITGKKILTTCQDNRLRVWDDWEMAAMGDEECSRVIVHSHTFSRHLTPFKAEINPQDPSERLAIIGRYISEDYGGFALHPIDLFDISTGAIVGSLVDPNLTTISPVNRFHPRRDVIITGSSRSLYSWKPKEEGKQQMPDMEHNVDPSLPSSSSGWRGAAQPRGSTNFTFFDAENDERKKKKKKT